MKSFLITIILFVMITACTHEGKSSDKPDTSASFVKQRNLMVKQIQAYGVKDRRVLNAMKKIPRHLFIPENYRQKCNPYGNHPCPIGYSQTISQPFIVAFMTSAVFRKKGEKILEIGTGSGYQSAVLAELGMDVYTIEIIPGLYRHARSVIRSRGYTNVKLLRGDGYKGWKEYSPYDAIIVTCAPEKIPSALIKQLKDSGRMIIPVGKYSQKLIILKKKNGKLVKKNIFDVRFVPMVHEK